MTRFPLSALGLLALPSALLADDPKPLACVHRVVFLGDSITYAGQYVEYLEAYLRAKDPSLDVEFLNLGLPSETVSGLSEPGHAGGSFPRPDLHERLGRVLEKTKPDLIIACYGMNDGIYHPYGEDRFRRYREGMERLRAKAREAGVRVLHVTPPVFDPIPIKANTLPAGLAEYRRPYEGYDDVLNLYAAWLLAERGDGWDVADVHGPMKNYLDNKRRVAPDFRLAGDGVHADAEGHLLMALVLLRHLGIPQKDLEDVQSPELLLRRAPHGEEILSLVRKKQRLLKDAWLNAVGHRRPGMAAGLPLEEAQAQAKAIDRRLREVSIK